MKNMKNIHIHRIGFTKHGATLEDAKQFPLFLNKYFYLFLSPIKATQLHFKNNFQIIWAMMAHTSGVPSAIFKTIFPKVRYILDPYKKETLLEHIEKIAHYGGPISWFLFKQGFTKADVIQSISYYLSGRLGK
jgi:hypothetical protein